MIRLLVVALWLAFLSGPVHGAFEFTRSISPGPGTFDPLAPWALFWHANPATLGLVPGRFTAAAAQPYGLPELSAGMSGVVVRMGPWTGAVGFSSLGQGSLYRESDLSVSIAASMWNRFHLGVTAHRLGLQFGPRFSGLAGTSFDTGIWLQVHRRLGLGAAATDALAGYVGGRPLLHAGVSATVSFLYSGRLALRAGAQHRRGNWSFSVGETIGVTGALQLLAELEGRPLVIRAGLQLSLGSISFQYRYRDHPELGGDQMASLSLEF